MFGFEQVFGVIDEHFDGGAVAAQGQPAVGFEEFKIEVLEQAAIDHEVVVKGQEGAAVEAGEGVAEVGFGDAVGVEQDGFDVTAFAAGLRHGTAQVVAAQHLLLDQVIKFGWAPLYQLRLIAQCEPKRFGNV